MSQKDEYILNSQHTDSNGKVYNAGDSIKLTQTEARHPIFANKLRESGVINRDLTSQGEIDNLQMQLEAKQAELDEANKRNAELQAGNAGDTGSDTGDGKGKPPAPQV